LREIEAIDEELRKMSLKPPDPDKPGYVSVSEDMCQASIKDPRLIPPTEICEVCHRESTEFYPITLRTPPMNERGTDRIWGDMSRRMNPELKGMQWSFFIYFLLCQTVQQEFVGKKVIQKA
jgi:hypothetical protein